MKALAVTDASYSRLLRHIKQEISVGLARARHAFEREKILSYWRIGQAIGKHLAQNTTSADYGNQLYSSLSRDLGLGERLLYQISQFYNTYPDLKPSENLKWSHYRLLTSVKDNEQRNALEAKASADSWSQRTLDAFIKDNKEKSAHSSTTKPKKLNLIKGRLYTYTTFKADYARNLLIDCGFNVYHESEITNMKGSFVESVKTDTSYKLNPSDAAYKHLYTYKAYVQKIVDGDTLWVIVDCGFKVWIHQKLRLRGVNTPGITTPVGMAAYKFVCTELKDLPFVVIKTHGRDKYDRYLADVFYLKGEDNPQTVLYNGAFLNQKLLDECLAVNES